MVRFKTKKFKQKRKFQFSVMFTALCVFLILYTLTHFILYYWGIMTALKTDYPDFTFNELGLPSPIYFGNLTTVFQNFYVSVTSESGQHFVYLGEQLLNTVLYAGGCALCASFVPCIVAYAATKFNYFYSKILTGIVIVTMSLPIVGSYPAMIKVMNMLQIYDTFIGTWLQKCNFTTMYFLVYCASYKVIPKDFSEAAAIDGASEWGILGRIMLPLIRNVFFTVFLIYFIEFWNDYQVSLLYLPTHPTVAVGIYRLSFSTNPDLANTPVKMMGCLILMVPILIVFIVFRNKIMGNLSMGGVKE